MCPSRQEYISFQCIHADATLTMNSEAMIPSTMAQKNDAMTPMLMNMIAAKSLRTEFKTSLHQKKKTFGTETRPW